MHLVSHAYINPSRQNCRSEAKTGHEPGHYFHSTESHFWLEDTSRRRCQTTIASVHSGCYCEICETAACIWHISSCDRLHQWVWCGATCETKEPGLLFEATMRTVQSLWFKAVSKFFLKCGTFHRNIYLGTWIIANTGNSVKWNFHSSSASLFCYNISGYKWLDFECSFNHCWHYRVF